MTMRRYLLFVFGIFAIMAAISWRGVTGNFVFDASFGNLAISSIGLIVLFFILALFTFKKDSFENIQRTQSVWDELERAEEEWLRKRGK